MTWQQYNKDNKKAYDKVHKALPNVRQRNNELRKIRIAKNRELLYEYKASTPCFDCGKVYPHYVMDFDHLRDKKFDISKLASRNVSFETIKSEIEKCDLVCSNCHRIRTYGLRKNIEIAVG